MKLVIIESPYAGNVERNLRYARACMRDSINKGEAPLATHLIYPQEGILNDNDKFERQIGIKCGSAWAYRAELIAFYIDFGMSPGMLEALKVYTEACKRFAFEFRKLNNFKSLFPDADAGTQSSSATPNVEPGEQSCSTKTNQNENTKVQ